VKNGEYFTNDSTIKYLDVEMWGPEDSRYMQLSSLEQAVDSGTYRVSCNARSDGGGVCLFATTPFDKYKVTKMIPASGKEGGLGNGWQKVELEVKVDGPTPLRYGISTYSPFTQTPCHATWFSAADFAIERVDSIGGREHQIQE
jgi:hypothetical protein